MIKFNYTTTNVKALMKIAKNAKYFNWMVTDDSYIVLSSTCLLMFEKSSPLFSLLKDITPAKLDARTVEVVQKIEQKEIIRIKYSDFEKGEIPELIRYKHEGKEYYFNHSLFLPCIKGKRSEYTFAIYTYEHIHGVNIYDPEGNYCGLILGMKV